MRTAVISFAVSRPVRFQGIFIALELCFSRCEFLQAEHKQRNNIESLDLNKHLIRRLRRHLPLKGKARAKPFFLPVDFFFEQFSDTHSAPSFCVYSLPLEGKVARRYTYDQPSQEIIGLTHERQHEASIRTGRAPSTGRAMLAPTGAGFLMELSFRKWQFSENLRRI